MVVDSIPGATTMQLQEQEYNLYSIEYVVKAGTFGMGMTLARPC